MLWHIELKFCIWLCFTVLHIKLECRQFTSVFVGVMPLLDLRILEIHSIPHFSGSLALTYWSETFIWLCFTVLQIKFECHQFASILIRVMPLLDRRILKIQFSALFSYMLWHFELKFCIWLSFTVLHIKFDCSQYASIFVEVMTRLDLRIMERHSIPHFSLHALTYWAEILHMTLF